MSPALDRDWDKSQHIMSLIHKMHVFSSIQDSYRNPPKNTTVDKWFTPTVSAFIVLRVFVRVLSLNGGHGAGHMASENPRHLSTSRHTFYTHAPCQGTQESWSKMDYKMGPNKQKLKARLNMIEMWMQPMAAVCNLRISSNFSTVQFGLWISWELRQLYCTTYTIMPSDCEPWPSQQRR